MLVITGKMPCKYGPVFALYLYCTESNRVNTVQKWSVFTQRFSCGYTCLNMAFALYPCWDIHTVFCQSNYYNSFPHSCNNIDYFKIVTICKHIMTHTYTYVL